jgi:hypothetical protein
VSCWIRKTTVTIGWVACALLIPLPAFSEQSLVTPSGAVLQVWEHPERPDHGAGSGSRAIRFAVTDVGGRREGFLPGTEDAALDQHPRLAVDPPRGKPVVVWSHWDGSAQKIAYARFEGGEWRDRHMLTFGPGDDSQPRIGVTRDGAVLFWVSGRGRYMYAPVDLSAGHLMAPGRLIHPSSERRSSGRTLLTTPGDDAVQGNSDIPIWTACGHGKRPACSSSLGEPTRSPHHKPRFQGNTDIPIIPLKGQRALTWAVASSPGCRGLVIALPARDAHSLDIVVLENDSLRPLRREAVPAPIPRGFGANVASAYLSSICE